jgi:hypothetical protein
MPSILSIMKYFINFNINCSMQKPEVPEPQKLWKNQRLID